MYRSSICFGLALALASPAFAQSPTPASAPAAPAPAAFTLAPLPYAYDALEPAIDAETMRIHHGKHHQAYVDNLNRAMGSTPQLAGQSLEQIVAQAGELPVVFRNNAGGHWNHNFFWSIMAPPGQSGAPSAALTAAIVQQFGSMDQFKAQFKATGLGTFGSGWVWLVVQSDGKLAVRSTANQDNPLMRSLAIDGVPILGNDVWEHAYYLKHQNRRGDYLDGWWQVVNWKEVSRRYEEAVKTAKR